MKLLHALLLVSALLPNAVAIAKTVDAVASFSILSDIVKQIGGDRVKVITLVRRDCDPHNFEPSPQDSKLLSQADVVFVNGLGLEGWIDRLVSAAGNQKRLVIASHGINKQPMMMDKSKNKIKDPHAWNSMKNGIKYATNVMNALIATDPEDANYFRDRGIAYIQKLQNLDMFAKMQFSLVPRHKRKVLTSHNAFGYFGDEYGVTFISPAGLSTETESSASEVASLIKQIKQEKFSTYFIENQTDSRLIKQIAAATGAKAGGELYPEALSGVHGPAATYVQACKHNVRVLLSSMK